MIRQSLFILIYFLVIQGLCGYSWGFLEREQQHTGVPCFILANLYDTCYGKLPLFIRKSLRGGIIHIWLYTSLIFGLRLQQNVQLSCCFLPHEAMRSAIFPRQIVCPSVHPSVMLRYRDHIGWNSAKIISRLISLTFSLSTDPNMTDLLQREHPKF